MAGVDVDGYRVMCWIILAEDWFPCRDILKEVVNLRPVFQDNIFKTVLTYCLSFNGVSSRAVRLS